MSDFDIKFGFAPPFLYALEEFVKDCHYSLKFWKNSPVKPSEPGHGGFDGKVNWLHLFNRYKTWVFFFLYIYSPWLVLESCILYKFAHFVYTVKCIGLKRVLLSFSVPFNVHYKICGNASFMFLINVIRTFVSILRVLLKVHHFDSS